MTPVVTGTFIPPRRPGPADRPRGSGEATARICREIREWARAVETLGYRHILAYEHMLGAGIDTRPGSPSMRCSCCPVISPPSPPRRIWSRAAGRSRPTRRRRAPPGDARDLSHGGLLTACTPGLSPRPRRIVPALLFHPRKRWLMARNNHHRYGTKRRVPDRYPAYLAPDSADSKGSTRLAWWCMLGRHCQARRDDQQRQVHPISHLCERNARKKSAAMICLIDAIAPP